MIEVSQTLIEKLFFDPVLAAWVLMGAKLDVFQQARLRFYWWCPEVIDSSGVGTGKTEVDFIYLCLRCTLIPNHWAAVYFPVFQTGKDVFWSKFVVYEDQSELFRSQFNKGVRKQDEEKAQSRNPGAYIRRWKNGSHLFMPAPDFKGDSKNQASRDFNTVLIDDYLRADDQGEGIDKQLIDRARRHSFNKNHPLWCNHVKFLGHAGSPQHRSYRRFRAFRRAIHDGSSRHALVTFCYKDWTPALAKKFREDNIIRTQKATLTRDAFRRQYLGIWTLDGENYYSVFMINGARRAEVVPMATRLHQREVYILGQDVAEPGSKHADWCTWVVVRVVEVRDPLRATFEYDGRWYYAAYVFAHVPRGARDAGQIAALTYKLHRMFGFSVIVLDPGGGGRWVLAELRKSKQMIDGAEQVVIPLTTRDDPNQLMKQPIVSLFKRPGPAGGMEWEGVVQPDYLTGDEGIIENAHMQFRDALQGRHVLLPASFRQREPAQVTGWSRELIYAQYYLDVMAQQGAQIRLLKRPDGSYLTSRRHFKLFESKRKKDVWYAGMYAWMGVRLWLKDESFRGSTAGNVAFSVV